MNDFAKLKTLLLQDEIDEIDQIKNDISSLKNQQERDVLVDRLSTIITDILSKSLKDNQIQLYYILHPIISKGVIDELNDSNNNLKEILFPIITSSIQEQVREQRDSIVDALYPITGSMINRYITKSFIDMMHKVNDKIQNLLLLPQIKRKIKSKIYDISEDELILQESNFMDIRDIFLIHKESGLLIADIHKNNQSEIEENETSSIVNFIGKWINNHNNINEIDEIEYGDLSIYIESTDSCYLAVVSNNNANIKDRLSEVLSRIIDRHLIEIVEYNGDNSTIDIINIKRLMARLFEKPNEKREYKTPLLSILFFSILLLIPIAYYTNISYESYIRIEKEMKIKSILKKHHIHVYDLQIRTDQNHSVIIDGLVMNSSDKNRTDIIFRGIKHKNNLRSINQNFDRDFDKNYHMKKLVKLKQSLKQITNNINKKYGLNIRYTLIDDVIIFKGIIIDAETKNKIITKLSDNLGGVDVEYDFILLETTDSRIYFDINSDIILKEYNIILDKIASLHKENSKYIIKISAYTDLKGSKTANKKISYRRANRVKVALIKRGIDRDKIIVEYRSTPPADLITVDGKKSRSLSRCVIFRWKMDDNNTTIKDLQSDKP